MKRIFTFILAAVSLQVSAQNLMESRGNELSPAEKQAYEQARFQFKQNALNKTNATESGWYNYLDALNESGLGTTTTYYFNMFNDSTVQTLYKNSTTGVVTADYVNAHHFGMCVDARGDCYDNYPYQGNRFTKYTLDSVAIPYGYRRHNPNPNIVDTLVVQVYAPSSVKYFSLTSSGVVVGEVDYDYTTNMGKTPYKTTKILLTSADTAIGLRYKYAVLSPALAIPARGQAVASYKYVSGQSYNLGDTLNADFDVVNKPITNKINELRAFMARETTLYDQSTTLDATYNRVYNNGLIAFSDVRYNNAGTWNGVFVGGNAYIGFHYIPDMDFKITTLNVGINDAAREYLSDIQVYPNPSNGSQTVTVAYKLTKSANVSIEIVNVLGKKISSVEVGKKDNGTQSQSINVSELANGIYFANVYVDGISQTVKFTVTK